MLYTKQPLIQLTLRAGFNGFHLASLQIEYFKAYQLPRSNWKQRVQFSFCEHLVVTRRWHTGDYNLFIVFCREALPRVPLAFISLDPFVTHTLTLKCDTHRAPSFHTPQASPLWSCLCVRSQTLCCVISGASELLIVLSLSVLICTRWAAILPSLSLLRSAHSVWSCVDQMSAIHWQLILIKAAVGEGAQTRGTLRPSRLSADPPLLIRLTVRRYGSAVCSYPGSTCYMKKMQFTCNNSL